MIYYIVIKIFSLAIAVAAIFDKKARSLFRGRQKLVPAIEQQMADIHALNPNAKTTWIHCASLGEFEQGRPIIEAIKDMDPQHIIVLTFFSPSGFQTRKNYPLASAVFYLPADTPSNAKRTVRAIKPNNAIFVKYEYWHNFLKELSTQKCNTYLVSAYFLKSMPFFKWWGTFFRNMLARFTHIFVQNQKSKTLLQTIDINNVTVAGDTRFDRVADIVRNAPQIELVEKFKGNNRVMVCGSTWHADQEILATLINEREDVKFIIAPHEVNDGNIEKLMSICPSRKIIRYSQSNIHNIAESDVLIIDCIGLLSGIYRYGHIGYIGGGFGSGIHNILEAATWGLPVIFGPKYERFAEAVDMIELGAAVSVVNYQELETAYKKIEENYDILSATAKGYVQSRCGATDIIIKKLF